MCRGHCIIDAVSERYRIRIARTIVGVAKCHLDTNGLSLGHVSVVELLARGRGGDSSCVVRAVVPHERGALQHSGPLQGTHISVIPKRQHPVLATGTRLHPESEQCAGQPSLQMVYFDWCRLVRPAIRS